MTNVIDKINAGTYSDYSKNSSSVQELKNFKTLIEKDCNVLLDQHYLDFLSKLNGFELNGLNFYGTKEQTDIYVLSAVIQNQFWRNEVSLLSKYYILADGDLDFYCFDHESQEYMIFSKDDISKVNAYCDFEEFMNELLNIYM